MRRSARIRKSLLLKYCCTEPLHLRPDSILAHKGDMVLLDIADEFWNFANLIIVPNGMNEPRLAQSTVPIQSNQSRISTVR